MGLCVRALRVEELPEYLRLYDGAMAYSDSEYLVLLESCGDPSLGRYSFLGADPFLVFRSKRNECWAGPPNQERKLDGHPFTELARLLAHYKAETTLWSSGLPPFLGGALGYIGYELLHLIEGVPEHRREDDSLPDCWLAFCDVVIASDHALKKTWIAATGFGETLADAGDAAAQRLRDAVARIARVAERRPAQPIKVRPGARLREEDLEELGITPILGHEAYVNLVDAVKEHIAAGDVFEVCLTNRFDFAYEGSGFHLYGVLSSVSEAPFASYVRFPGIEIVSSSPERFLRLDREGWAETRPMKGTRPRGHTPAEDDAYYEDLATCEKDQAENVMIVDLARNDLGRVCKFGSITVPELRVIESYPFTHQLVSTIRGQLSPQYGPVDLIKATFPGGSMTGAPKVEAMKIIKRLEPVERGIFSGSIGYFDFDGSFDLNIVIRTCIKSGGRMTFHVGGAIVADSDPEEEYQETLDKAHGIFAALEISRSLR